MSARNRFFYPGLILLLVVFAFPAAAQHLLINEYMSSNATTLADDDGNYSDWVEIYNAGDESINLLNYGLSDNPSNLYKWRFPAIELNPGHYLLVWLSGKNHIALPALHTSFSLNSQGEEIILTSASGIILDFITPVPLPSDVSYGRSNGDKWNYYTEPTPGGLNDSEGYYSLLPPPVFSHESGFYTSAFDLSISSSDPASTIYYTLDGSEPDVNNLYGTTFQYKNDYPQFPGNSFGPLLTSSFITLAYQQPIPVTDRSPLPDSLSRKASAYYNDKKYFPDTPLFKGTVVRAIAVKPGYLTAPPVTAVFFITPEGREKFSLPVVSFTTNAAHLFDYHKGIYTPGVDFDNWRKQEPQAASNGGRPANYKRRGDEAEYPASISIFEPSSTVANHSQDVGFRIHGGWSRAYPMKTLRLVARNRYGASSISYPVFPDQAYNEYSSLLLRNSGNDWAHTLFRDALIQRVVKHLNVETLAYRPAVVFINGEYWGIHNLRERYEKYYFQRVFGVDAENIDYLEFNAVAKEGDNVHYLQTLGYISTHDITREEHYQYIQTRIDTENFIDYQVANIYAANSDWPGNNIDYWRLRTPHYIPDAPYGHDGRWRWLIFDTDFGFGYANGFPSPTHNTLAMATQAGLDDWPNPDWSTFLLRNLLLNPTFRDDFINRFCDQLNTAFLPNRVIGLLQDYKKAIDPEMPAHIDRWKSPESITEWNANVITNRLSMQNFILKRPVNQFKHLQDYFGLADTLRVHLDVSNLNHGYLSVNTIAITPATPGVSDTPYPWSGIYFKGVTIKVEAVPMPGYRFSHWEGYESSDSVILADPLQIKSLKAIFEPINPTQVVHHWHFNNLPASDQLEIIPSDFSYISPASITYPGSGSGYMDRVTEGTLLNKWQEDNAGNALRVRNPSHTRQLTLQASSEGFTGITLSYAASRTVNGAEKHMISFSADNGTTWTPVGDTCIVTSQWNIYSHSLSGFPEANNCPGLIVRITFYGSNSALSSGNNRFDNMTFTGTPLFTTQHFYSKTDGEITDLSTWGSEPDGGGEMPKSFDIPSALFHIVNRDKVTLSQSWSVTGRNSAVVLGNNADSIAFTVPDAFALDAAIRLTDYAHLVLHNASIPAFETISRSSVIEFSPSVPVSIPAGAYGRVILKNSTFTVLGMYHFYGDLTAISSRLNIRPDTRWIMEGNLVLQPDVATDFTQNLTVEFTGKNNQSVSAPVLTVYNFYADKKAGTLTLGGDVFAGNNIRLEFRGKALFSDGGFTLRYNDDLRLLGDGSANYRLSGTFHLTSTTGTNEFEGLKIPLHNLHIDISGNARPNFFLSGDMIRIENNLTIKSRSSRPILLYDKYYQVGGNLNLDLTQASQIDHGNSTIHMFGFQTQWIINNGLASTGILQNLLIDNAGGVQLGGSGITIKGWLHWNKGLLSTSTAQLLNIAPMGYVSSFKSTGFTNGPMTFHREGDTKTSIIFPIGKPSFLRPLRLETSNTEAIIFTAEYFHETPPSYSENPGKMASMGYYLLEHSGTPSFIDAIISIDYSFSGIDSSEVRLVMLKEGIWAEAGTRLKEQKSGILTTGLKLPSSAMLALASFSPSDTTTPNVLIISPNPCPQGHTIRLGKPATYRIFDIHGKLIKQAINSNQIITLDMIPGLYILRTSQGEVEKVVISP
jgi:hypothetical protein